MDVKSRVPGVAQEIYQPVYDTISLPAAAVTGTFFAVPQGGVLTGAINKTRRDTNLVQASQLEKGVSLFCDSIAMAFTTRVVATTADIENFFEGSFVLNIGQRQVLELPTRALGNAGAVTYRPAVTTTVAATTFENMLNGIPAFQNRYHLPRGMEIGIEEQTTIQAVVGDFLLVAAVEVTCFLFGILTRPLR